MRLVRQVEQFISDAYDESWMRCPTHLSIGQEATPAVLSQFISRQDFCVSGHRAHAHYLSKGGNLARMLYEIAGLPNGCSGGYGGSMHLVDREVGFVGSTAIVGGIVPVGVGVGLAITKQKSKSISIIYIGDSVLETGVFYESLNFATVHRLPVLFVCENNGYSVYTHLKQRQPNSDFVSRVAGFGCKASEVNGNCVFSLYNELEDVVSYVRSGYGPAFIQADTYRWLEHCGPNNDDHLKYRDQVERDKWLEMDPLRMIEKAMIEDYSFNFDSLKAVDMEIKNLLREAVQAIESCRNRESYTEPQNYQTPLDLI